MNRNESVHAVGRFSTVSRMAALGALALSVTAAYAAPQTLNARQRASDVSSFTLDFGDFGGERTANITATTFSLEIDDAAGTAEFVSYHQNVDPLLLPGDISTGAITVEVVPGTSTGVYDANTGEFTTTELYAVHFEGDLSAYGLESPVYLPSTSTGVVIRTGIRFGRVELNWDGVGQLANPFDPATPIEFSYACDVEAAFGFRALQPEADPAALRASGDAQSQTGCTHARTEEREVWQPDRPMRTRSPIE